MLGALKFVQGAVGTKDYAPEMKHFVIRDGAVVGYNGVLALSAPVDVDITCAPLATPMVRAIGQCEDVVSLSLAGDRLRIASGKFTAQIPCTDIEAIPDHNLAGVGIDVDGGVLVEALRKVLPFVGDDATRPWSNGVLLKEGSAFATNNVCLVQCWLGVDFGAPVIVPRAAVHELLRVGQPPAAVHVTDSSASFLYADGRWIKTALLTGEWPDLARILDQPCSPQPVPEGLFSGLAAVKPFADRDQFVDLGNGLIAVGGDTGLVEAEYALDCDIPASRYKLRMLQLLEGVATHIDFRDGSAPAAFLGDRIRGAIAGVRR